MTEKTSEDQYLLAQSELIGMCEKKEFSTGENIRTLGAYYTDMYIILEGDVQVDPRSEGRNRNKISVGAGKPIGEICFLRGIPATATVIALSNVRVAKISDNFFSELNDSKPKLAAQLLRELTRYADDRSSYNLRFEGIAGTWNEEHPIEIRLCRNDEMLREAQRLRYSVYCEELGRNSPNADHEQKLLKDDLDDTGYIFLCVQQGDVIGTTRVNLAFESKLGMLTELYGMKNSECYPKNCGIITKFMVRRSHRRSVAAMKMMSHMAKFGRQRGIKETYIDCIPQLAHYYSAVGLRVSGEQFLHPENGVSIPMKLDVDKYYRRLSADPSPLRMLQFYTLAKLHKFLGKIDGRWVNYQTND